MTKSAGDSGCVFCSIGEEHIIARNGLAYTVRDTSPVTPLHTLIFPKRHMAEYFDLDAKEKLAIGELLEEARRDILTRDPAVAGFNIGINVGAAAGQTIFHCHVHLIPRRPDDVANPRGGVRAVIPGRANY
jgi:diadenosine tetraphosphate (Ap4A) HIT family hydrolase